MLFPWLIVAVTLVTGGMGCVSKAKARRQAQVAYHVGQLQSPEHARMVASTVMVRGQVRNPIVAWRPDMTLSEALLDAGFQGRTDPHRITVTRQGTVHVVDVRRLLKGLDNPSIQPGDLIELQ